MSLLISYGTRPEYIKISKLLDVLTEKNIEYKILYSGQHQNIVKMDSDYSFSIVDGVNRLDSIISSSMNVISTIQAIENDKITHVMVQGDTTTALAIALSAFNHKLKVIHLEAGLRTYDKENPYPEEINRRIISQIADIHLCPTIQSQQNLFDEGIRDKVFVVGNTVIDNLLKYKGMCEYTDKILVTLHRRENHDLMDKWFNEINELAKKHNEYEFVIPMHPNPNVQKHRDILTNVSIIEPLNYEDMLNLLVKTKLVITDSGGLQEECSYFNKKCLVCRVVTERPETIGKSTFMVKSPNKLIRIFEKHHNDYNINYVCPFGDGNSSVKIINILKNEIS